MSRPRSPASDTDATDADPVAEELARVLLQDGRGRMSVPEMARVARGPFAKRDLPSKTLLYNTLRLNPVFERCALRPDLEGSGSRVTFCWRLDGRSRLARKVRARMGKKEDEYRNDTQDVGGGDKGDDDGALYQSSSASSESDDDSEEEEVNREAVCASSPVGGTASTSAAGKPSARGCRRRRIVPNKESFPGTAAGMNPSATTSASTAVVAAESAASGPGMGEVDTILCLYCQASIHFAGLPPLRYHDHLFKEHNILFDLDAIVDRTLRKQLPHYTAQFPARHDDDKLMLEAGAQANLLDAPPLKLLPRRPWHRQSFEQNKILKKLGPSGEEEKSKSDGPIKEDAPKSEENDDVPPPPPARKEEEKVEEKAEELPPPPPHQPGPGRPGKKRTLRLPFYAGCEYQCRVCQWTYFYVEDLRSHVRREHGDPDEYLDEHRVFETKAEHAQCKECGKEIKRNFFSFRNHLRDRHSGMTMDEYRVKFKQYMTRPYVVSSRLLDPLMQKNGSRRRDGNCNALSRSSSIASSGSEKVGKKAAGEKQQQQKKEEQQQRLADYSPSPSPASSRSSSRESSSTTSSANLTKRQAAALTFTTRSGKPRRPSAPSLVSESVSAISGKPKSEEPPPKGGNERKRSSSKTLGNKEEEDGKSQERKRAKVSKSPSSSKSSSMKKESLGGNNCEDMDGKSSRRISLSSCTSSSLSRPATPAPSTPGGTKKRPEEGAHRRPGSGAGRRPWFSGCEYRCRVCDRLHLTLEPLVTHLRRAHDVNTAEYKRKHGGFETTSAKFKCEICGEKMKHTEKSIRVHLESNHLMTLNMYEKAVLSEESSSIATREEEKPVEKGEKPGPKSSKKRKTEEADSATPSDARPVKVLKLSLERMASVNVTKVSEKPEQKEEERASTSSSSSSNKEEEVAYGDELSSEDENSDGEMMVGDIVSQGGACETEEAKNKDEEKKKGGEGEHRKKEKDEKVKEEGLVNQEGVKEKEEEEEEDDKNPEFSCLEEFLRSSCKYSCKMCGFLCDDSTAFWNHALKEHLMSPAAYRRTHGKPRVEESKLECPSCYAIFPHEPTALRNHAKDHGTTPDVYFRTLFQKETAALNRGGDGDRVSEKKPRPPPVDGGEDARLREWATRCQYVCRLCGEDMKYLKNACVHIRKVHGKTTEEYGGSMMSKKVLHECLLCHKKVLHLKASLTKHITNGHGVSLKNYFKRYILTNNLDSPDSPKKSGEGSDGAGNHVQSKKRGRKVKEHTTWADQCRHFCKICKFESFSARKIALHLNTRHDMSLPIYTEKYGSTEVERKMHSCCLCGRSISHTYMNLLSHMKIHDLGVQDYYYQFIKGREQTIPPSAPQSSQAERDYAEELPDSKEDNLPPPLPPPPPASTSSSALLESSPSSDWMNGCKYECAECQGRLTSLANFREHLEQVHSVADYDSYVGTRGDPAVEVRLFSCALCGKSLVHDADEILPHLASAHGGLAPEHYYAEHIDPSSKGERRWKQQEQTDGGGDKSIAELQTENNDFGFSITSVESLGNLDAAAGSPSSSGNGRSRPISPETITDSLGEVSPTAAVPVPSVKSEMNFE